MGKIFRFVRYKTHEPRGDLDFDEIRALARAHRPKLILCGHSSYPREIDYAAFRRVAEVALALRKVSTRSSETMRGRYSRTPLPWHGRSSISARRWLPAAGRTT